MLQGEVGVASFRPVFGIAALATMAPSLYGEKNCSHFLLCRCVLTIFWSFCVVPSIEMYLNLIMINIIEIGHSL